MRNNIPVLAVPHFFPSGKRGLLFLLFVVPPAGKAETHRGEKFPAK